MVESGLGLPNTILQYLRQLNGVSMRVDLRFSCQNIKCRVKGSNATLISLSPIKQDDTSAEISNTKILCHISKKIMSQLTKDYMVYNSLDLASLLYVWTMEQTVDVYNKT